MSSTSKPLSDAERLDWLRLIRSENVGPITFFQLLGHYGSAAEALRALPALARRGGRRTGLRVFPRADAERELAGLAALGARLIGRVEPDYPPLLAEIADPPPLIAIRGHGHLVEKPTVAIVGARNASANGVRLARALAADLAAEGYVVISGLARGIDAAAHQGALAGGTLAVLAGGVDMVYPPENAALHERIAEEGGLIAEQPLGTVPMGRHFPRRNRIISGAALGVVVVEAAPRSGSLITARLAGEQGREVFAVPGSPLDPRCRGTNGLIRDGAVLTERAGDVIAVLAGLGRRPFAEPETAGYAPAPSAPPAEVEIDAARARVVEKLSPTAVAVDELIRQCQVTATVVHVVLLELELAGRLDRYPGNLVSLKL